MHFGFWSLDSGLSLRTRFLPLAAKHGATRTLSHRRRTRSLVTSSTQNPKYRIQNRRRGFALVDVILGGILLSIGLAAIISLATRALKSQTDGEKQVMAAWLCDELLALVVVDGPVNYPRQHDTSGQFEYPFQEFSYDLEIVNQGNDVPYAVIATVSWQAGRGVRSVQVQTLISLRKDDPEETRVPEEPIDREERWYGEEETTGGTTGGAGG